MTSSFLSTRRSGPLRRSVATPLRKDPIAGAPDRMPSTPRTPIGIDLSAALITVRTGQPMVLLVEADRSQVRPQDIRTAALMLPAGPLQPQEHRTLEAGVRSLVAMQLGIDLGYIEQLYTFAEQGRVIGGSAAAQTTNPADNDDQPHLVSVGYLALMAATHAALGARDDAVGLSGAARGCWVKCYDVLPWEDWRSGRPAMIAELIEPPLQAWANQLVEHPVYGHAWPRQHQIDVAFGLNGAVWDDERALDRHELLYAAGLLCEARRDDGVRRQNNRPERPDTGRHPGDDAGQRFGIPLALDHRRMLAMALGRLRAKIKYRPIVFDLMAETFTLYELQCTVQAILGTPLHKQNFRRLVETTGLVEDVGEIRTKTGGRPAKLFRFRPDVILERSAPGVRIKSSRV